MIKCFICNKEFTAYRFLAIHLNKYHKKVNHKDYYDLYIDKNKQNNKCLCNEPLKFNNLSSGYKKTCGNIQCRKKLKIKNKRETNLKRYGVINYTQTEEYKQKVKETSLKKYGCEHFLSSRKVINKRKNSILEEHGVDNTFKREDIKIKIKNTNLNNLGVDNPQKSKIIRNKTEQTNIIKYGNKSSLRGKDQIKLTKQTNLKKYGNEVVQRSNYYKLLVQTKMMNRLLHSDRLKDKFIPLFTSIKNTKDKNLLWKCKKCGNEFLDGICNGEIPRCFKCEPRLNGTSHKEIEIADFLEKYTNIERNKRFYYDGHHYLEIDIYLSEFNIGIEFDGLYSHCVISGKKDDFYHINKTNYFKNLGIQIIHIFENEWVNQKEIVKSILLSKIGMNINKIFARKCEVKLITNEQSILFLMNNHIQGSINSFIRLGLFYNNELVSLMTFNKSRFNKNYTFELTRYCNKLNFTIIGGFAKLLKYFILNYSNSIISYADLRYSNGSVYYKNNFILSHITSPNYFYIKNKSCKLENRLKYQKHKLSKILDIYDPILSEWENMQLNKYDRIFDCGNLVFTYKNN